MDVERERESPLIFPALRHILSDPHPKSEARRALRSPTTPSSSNPSPTCLSWQVHRPWCWAGTSHGLGARPGRRNGAWQLKRGRQGGASQPSGSRNCSVEIGSLRDACCLVLPVEMLASNESPLYFPGTSGPHRTNIESDPLLHQKATR
jgi:hypothetical protein